MAADRDEDLETYVDGWMDGFRVSRESTFGLPPPSPPSSPPPDSKKNKKNKKDKKRKKDKKGQKDMKTVNKSKKDKKNKEDKKGKNDKKYEKAKKTEKGRKDFAMTLTIKPGIDYDYDIACQKEESTMTLQVSGFDTIGEVKRMIEDMRRLEGRPPAIYSNRVGLADAYTLSFIFGKQWGFADANTLMFYNIPGRAHLSLEEE